MMKKLFILLILCTPLTLCPMDKAAQEQQVAALAQEKLNEIMQNIPKHFAAGTLSNQQDFEPFYRLDFTNPNLYPNDPTGRRYAGAEHDDKKPIALINLFNGPFGAKAIPYMLGLIASVKQGNKLNPQQIEQAKVLLKLLDEATYYLERSGPGSAAFNNYDDIMTITASYDLKEALGLLEE